MGLAEQDSGRFEIGVRDEGPGVPEQARDKIFEKYGRLDRDAESSVRESRGLGLAFCRLAVRAHGGDIWVEANRPVGSWFRISLPRSPEGSAAQYRPASGEGSAALRSIA